MFRFDEGLKVYLHREAIDFRVGLNGLAVMVEQALGLDPFAEAVYVFRNQLRDREKMLGLAAQRSLAVNETSRGRPFYLA
jgi:transposase